MGTPSSFPLRTAVAALRHFEGPDARPAEIRRFADGNTVIVGGRRFIVRIGHAWPLDAGLEARCCAEARRGGVPAPEVVDIGAWQGRPYLVYRRLDGHHPRPGRLSDPVARTLVRLHACDPEPFPNTQKGRPRRRERFHLAAKALDGGLLGPRAGAVVAPFVAAAAADWAGCRDVPAHGDYRAPNLLAWNGRVTGVLDWTDVRRASRESDLGQGEVPGIPPLVAAYEKAGGVRVDRVLVAGHALARHLALAGAGVLPRAAAADAARSLLRWAAAG